MTLGRRVVALLVAVTGAAALLAGCGGGSIRVTAVFDDVGDLQSRHSVQVADVRVGRIAGIKLTDDYRARVTMSLNPRYEIPENSEALVRTTSLLGEKFVEIRPLGDPDKGPYLKDGSVIERTGEAPELEFVASELVEVLGAVQATDIATLAETGAEAFAGRGDELRGLIDDLATISSTLASRSTQIGQVIDNLGSASGTLAGGAGEVDRLFGQLDDTSQVLADNRQRVVDALAQLTRLAAVQNEVLGRYRSDIDRQIKQADAILSEVAAHTGEVGLLVDWLHVFSVNVPRAIPGDFTQVFMWIVPAQGGPGSPTCMDHRVCSP
jgi:phospholipid/cholesterol/gamma-HCH transport system substrate-binding protein